MIYLKKPLLSKLYYRDLLKFKNNTYSIKYEQIKKRLQKIV